MALEALRPVSDHLSLHERIYLELRRALLEDAFKSGERIYENQIAQRLGVSRVPVREAVRRLQQEGLLEVRARGGVYVSSILPEDVDDVYRLRGAVEAVAAGMAAERASDRELAAIGDLVDRLDGADPERAVLLADKFHRAIHAASHCDRVSQVLEPLYAQLMRFRRATLSLPERARAAEEGHRSIFAALRRRDPVAAESVMREHIESARQALLDALAADERTSDSR